jgi:PAS domain S-box-containing protein
MDTQSSSSQIRSGSLPAPEADSEQTLHESEERFRLAFEHAAFGMALVSTQGVFLQVNPFACQMFGYPEEELLQLSFQALTHPDDLHISLDLFHDLTRGQRDHGWLEKRYIHRDGHVIWAFLSTAAVRNASGKTLYLVSQIQDVSERKAAEVGLAEREAQYRSIFEATSDGLCICALDGRIVRVNPAFLQMHGYELDEVLWQPPTKLIHADLVPRFWDAVATIKTGGSFQIQGSHVRKDGTLFPVDVRALPFIYRATPHMLAIVRDVTEIMEARRLLEARVAARTRELSALYDVTAVASASLDLQIVLDQSLARILEVMACESASIHLTQSMIDHTPPATWHSRTPPAPRPCIKAWVNDTAAPQVLEQGAPLVLAVPEFDVEPPPGAAHPSTLCYGGVPIQAKGRTLGVLSVLRTARHKLGDEETALLAAIGAQLGVAVENARLYLQAEQLAIIEERQRLARDLHDSVTQTLYSANLLAESGRRTAAAGDAAGATVLFQRMGELTQCALKEMRLLVYELRPADLEQQGLTAALQRRLDSVESRTGIKTFLDVRGEAQLAPNVEAALYRIAQEALNNALKHADATEVGVTVELDPGHVRLAVVDNGRGIDAHDLAAKRGMGLAIMRERAGEMGADFTVDSKPDQGTRIEVHLHGRS